MKALVLRDYDPTLTALTLVHDGPLNRPGFTGGWFVQRLRDRLECVQVCIERLLCFGWRDVSDGAK